MRRVEKVSSERSTRQASQLAMIVMKSRTLPNCACKTSRRGRPESERKGETGRTSLKSVDGDPSAPIQGPDDVSDEMSLSLPILARRALKKSR